MDIKRTFLIVCISFLIMFNNCKKEEPKYVEIKIGYAPIADAAQIYVGIELGYFQQQGIDINLVQLASGPKILEALGAGSIDIGLSSYVPFVFARTAGIDVVAITGGAVEDTEHKEHAYLVRKDSEIETVNDMEGKTLALNGLKNIDDLIFQELMEKYEVDRSKIRIVEIPFPRMESVLLSKRVDIIAAIEPFVTRAIMHGSSKLLIYNYIDLYEKVPVACYVSREGWIESNKKLMENFILAFDQATDYCISNPDNVKTMIGKYANLTEEELEHIGLPTFSKKTDPEQLQDLINRMLKRGLIDKELNSRDMIYE